MSRAHGTTPISEVRDGGHARDDTLAELPEVCELAMAEVMIQGTTSMFVQIIEQGFYTSGGFSGAGNKKSRKLARQLWIRLRHG
jgi:hypothetical protein